MDIIWAGIEPSGRALDVTGVPGRGSQAQSKRPARPAAQVSWGFSPGGCRRQPLALSAAVEHGVFWPGHSSWSHRLLRLLSR